MRLVRGHVILALLTAAGLTLTAGCGSLGDPDRTAAAQMQRVELPKGAYPRFLAFSRDGSLWITEAGGDAIARLHPDGTLEQYRIPIPESTPGDIEEGPGGAMWAASALAIARIDPEGSLEVVADLRSSPFGVPGALTAGPDGGVWFTSNSTPPGIGRVSTAGTLSSYTVPGRGFELTLSGITMGPEGAFWFTQRAEDPWETPDAIGSMLPNGELRRWPLPDRRAGPVRIVTGPDGALWFTEQSVYRIGRISTDGRISEFPLRPGVVPFDIAVGPDRALWFSAGKRIGRITTKGRISTWPVPGAKLLAGLAPAEDGTIWVADSAADLVHHFKPPS